MREIKFRFWDGTSGNECMAYTADDGYITYSSGWKLSMTQAIKESNATEGYDKPKALMQYTGLKDKHGVEIYEGDVLKLVDSDIPRTVEFDKGCFVLANRKGKSVSYRELWEQLLPEVIGNIYENSELLEKSNG